MLGMGAPAAPVTLTEPSALTSIPWRVLLLNEVCGCPAGTTMLAAPPETRSPSLAAAGTPAPVTITPAPMFSVPLVTLMACPPVFRMVTFASVTALPAPDAT